VLNDDGIILHARAVPANLCIAECLFVIAIAGPRNQSARGAESERRSGRNPR